MPGGEWASLFEELAINVAEAPPLQPAPLEQDGLLNLFSPETPDATSNWSLRPRPICAAACSKRNLRSK